jgi:hypothetical protein
VHYEDLGIVVHKDDGAKWLGSGSVLKNSDGEYVMNFSEEYVDSFPQPLCFPNADIAGIASTPPSAQTQTHSQHSTFGPEFRRSHKLFFFSRAAHLICKADVGYIDDVTTPF